MISFQNILFLHRPSGFLRSTGFILEGFPQHSEEVSFLAAHHLYPDTVVLLSVEVSEVVKRLLPAQLDRWRDRMTRKREQKQLLKELRLKNRVRKKKKGFVAEIHAFITSFCANLALSIYKHMVKYSSVNTYYVNQEEAIAQRRAELLEYAAKSPRVRQDHSSHC